MRAVLRFTQRDEANAVNTHGRGVTDTQRRTDVCVNRFIWFTDLYIFPSIHPREHHIPALKEYPLTSRTRVLTSSKNKNNFCFLFFSLLLNVSLFVQTLVWQEAFPRDITSVIVNIHLRQIKDGLVLNQLNFGNVKLDPWLVWSERKFLRMTDDDTPAPRGRAVGGARRWLKEIPDH